MSDIAAGYAPPYGEKPISKCRRNYNDIQYSNCLKHLEVKFVGPRCPVCLLENKLEDAKMRIAELEEGRDPF